MSCEKFTALFFCIAKNAMPEREESMNLLLEVNWISILALSITFILFGVIKRLVEKINWSVVICISLVMGIAVGMLFSSVDNSYLIWIKLLGEIYVNAIMFMVAPLILVSVLSGFLSLKKESQAEKIGGNSIRYLLLSSISAIFLSILYGVIFKIGHSGQSIFASIDKVDTGEVAAYEKTRSSLYDVLLSLFPSNLAEDIQANNIVALVIVAIIFAVACQIVRKRMGEEKVAPFVSFVFSFKRILYCVLEIIIDLTPYGVFCLIAVSAGDIFKNHKSVVGLLELIAGIYIVAIIHGYVYNALMLRWKADIKKPSGFFRAMSEAQATAFTTQSSIGSLPITIRCLKNNVGISEEVADFTPSLGTTIGMPGCTCIWPILLVLFYINATGQSWGAKEYAVLAVTVFFLAFGSAGVPGIAVVTSVALFETLGLPVGAVVLMVPINSITDMIRTWDNVLSASTAAVIVDAKQKD